MRWTNSRRRCARASVLALVLSFLLQTSAEAATETTAGSRPRQIVDLGTLPGGGGSQATAINDRGWVVGWAGAGEMTTHAFVWRNGGMTDLGSLTGPTGSSSASDVNDRGEIVGRSTTTTGGNSAFLWHRGQMTDLGTLGGSFSSATGINDRGEVVGFSTTPTEEFHAFLWRKGHMIDLGTVEGSSFSSAEAINNRGQVVGESGGPVAWRRGVPTPLPLVPGAEFGSALDNNRHGDIVGYSGFPGGTSVNRAVIWRQGVPTDLGLQGGSSQALGVNDHRQVVGYRELVPYQSFGGFLWDGGTVTDLASLTGAGGYATAINNRGEIVGVSPTTNPFISHAVLWR